MIVGVSARVVPTLNGVDPRGLSITGISGVLELLGLTLWGVHLWRIMSGCFSLQTPESPPDTATDGVITASDRVGAVLDRYPVLLDTFLHSVFGRCPTRCCVE